MFGDGVQKTHQKNQVAKTHSCNGVFDQVFFFFFFANVSPALSIGLFL